MRILGKVLVLIAVTGTVACKKSKNEKHTSENPFPLKYSNELFSINLPKGWTYKENWEGLDGVINEVDFYNPSGSPVWFHCVKTFLPIQWKDIKEATDAAKFLRNVDGSIEGNLDFIDEIDSVEVGGYPASILYFANYVDNDTIIQKQFVTHIKDSHIVIYFNENFFYHDWEEAQELGDRIIGTIKIKKVKNPLDDDDVRHHALLKYRALYGIREEQDSTFVDE